MEIAKRMTSRALLVAAAAIAVAIAIVTVLPATPASAQSDESSGRIVARLLEDGRVEFGWQPAGGARVLPSARYFPADATVDRWLRSSPVEVDGAAIGRINARLLSDGRIEFAFTPTDGARIEPSARYFPPSARVAHWLRSTEITIRRAAPGAFRAVSASSYHTCAIRTDTGALECWGAGSAGDPRNERPHYGQSDAPEGSYSAVSAGAGSAHTCAIRTSNEIECWGSNHNPAARWNDESQSRTRPYAGQSDAPAGSYSAVSAGSAHTCAIRTGTGALECWGAGGAGDPNEYPHYGQSAAPEGSYSAVSAGSAHTCAIRTSDSAIECWGSNYYYGQTDAPSGSYSAVSAGGSHTCAIRTGTGAIECWGSNDDGESDAPAGSYSAVSADLIYTCAIRASDGAIQCWGENVTATIDEDTGETLQVVVSRLDPPAGAFRAVSVGRSHACAIRIDTGAIECWDFDGQSDAPEGSYSAVSAGSHHTCAIRTGTGAIECWGDNDDGQANPPTNPPAE